MIRAVVLGSLAAALFACGGGSDSSSGSSSSSGTTTSSGAGGGQPLECQEPAALAIGGTWAARGRLAVKLQGMPGGAISICPADQVGDSSLLFLLTMDHSGTTVSNVKATLCSLELPVVTAIVGNCDPMSASLVETQIVAPPAFIAALPSIASSPVGGKVTGTTPGSGVQFDPFEVTVGSSKPDPMMPKWDTTSTACDSIDKGTTKTCETTCVDDCTALRDDDKDGYPGVTVDVCGYTKTDKNNQLACNDATLHGQGYIDIQVDPKFTGSAVSSCELKGTVGSHVLYNLVGGSIFLAGALITVTSAIKSLPVFQVDASQSAFRMVRVDGKYGAPDWKLDPTDQAKACAAVIANQNQL